MRKGELTVINFINFEPDVFS